MYVSVNVGSLCVRLYAFLYAFLVGKRKLIFPPTDLRRRTTLRLPERLSTSI